MVFSLVPHQPLSGSKISTECVLVWLIYAFQPNRLFKLLYSLNKLHCLINNLCIQHLAQLTLHLLLQFCFCFPDVCDPGVSDQRHPSDQAHLVPGAPVSSSAGGGGEGHRAQKPLEWCPGWVCYGRGYRCLLGEGNRGLNIRAHKRRGEEILLYCICR